MNTEKLIFVGTYTRRGSEGIYSFEVDPETGALTQIGCASSEHPSHLALSPDRRFLYSVNELNEFQGQPGGAASAFAVDPSTGALSFLNQQPVRGAHPCHIEVHPSGRWLVTANYTGGSHSILPIAGDGRLEPLRTHLEHSESGDAKTHSSLFLPAGRFLVLCALGLSQVIVDLFDDRSGMAVPVVVADIPLGGPRHMALHPLHPRLYVINEINSTVCVLSIDHETGAIDLLQTLPTVPTDSSGPNACADLHLSHDARFLYGSNRGHNSLAAFAIGGDGLLTPIGHVSTGGVCPRGFGVLPNGLILVANEKSDDIVAFRIGPDGLPIPSGAVTSVPSPTCILPYAR